MTVTVTLVRHNMSSLFGDESVAETHSITENGIEVEVKEKEKEVVGDAENEQEAAIKRPAWLKQKKGISNFDYASGNKLKFFLIFKVAVKRAIRKLVNNQKSVITLSKNQKNHLPL